VSHITIPTEPTDDENYLQFLADRIQRLKATLARVETIGLASSTSVGQSKTYVNAREVEKQLYRTMAEYDAMKARANGYTYDPTVKSIIIKDGYDI
jgi:hypothetical protein